MNKELLKQIEDITAYGDLEEIIDEVFRRVYELGHLDGSRTSAAKVPTEPITGPDLLAVIQAAEDELGLTRSRAAEQFLLAIAYQESAWKWRKQVLASGNPGPARGYWQFEEMGGVCGVMTHARTRVWARALLERRGIPLKYAAAWEALATDNVLAAAFARLLVLSDPTQIPVDKDRAWQYYLRTWRPGKPDRGRWDGAWAQAQSAMDNV